MKTSHLLINQKRENLSLIWLFAAILAIVLLFFPLNLFAAEDDTTPPELVSIDISPASIDVTSAAATVTITARITDNLSGFDYGWLELWSPSDNQYKFVYIDRFQDDRISGTELDGLYEVTVEFPQFSEAGVWTVDYMTLYDITQNRQYYYEADLSPLGSTTVAVTSVPDTTSPVITDIGMSPAAIDVSSGDASITLTLTIEDDLAGFEHTEIYFYSPSDNQYRHVWIEGEYTRISGDEHAGTYQEIITFPQYSEAGDWRIVEVLLEDRAKNYWWHDEQDLVDMGLPLDVRSFTMISDPQDLQPPMPVSIEIAPEVVNTIQGPDSATFIVNLTDNLSGFQDGWVYASSPSSGQIHYIYISTYYLTSGDALNGEYQIIYEFPQYSEFGEWKIWLDIYDRTTNNVWYEPQDLEAMGLTTTFLMEGVILGDNNIIGPSGGTIESDDGMLTIEFPENALSEDTLISYTSIGRFEPVNIRIGDLPGLGTSIVEYDFEPDGLFFSEPVIVTINVNLTELTQNERWNLGLYLNTDTDEDGILDTFISFPPEQIIDITTTVIDGTEIMTFVLLLEHFSSYAVILPIEDGDADTTPPDVQISVPNEYETIQNGVTLVAEATDESSIDSVHFTIRQANGNGGIIIGYEDIPATQDDGTNFWELDFDSEQLIDGNYIIFAKAVDEYGNEGGSSTVHFSIRNLAVMELLPASQSYRAGRTMPIKFTLNVAESVNPNTPFVRNEELEIRVYETINPDNILQSSLFGDRSTDYRINSDTELYITNFKTSKTPTEYTVEIWNTDNDFLLGTFYFETTRK